MEATGELLWDAAVFSPAMALLLLAPRLVLLRLQRSYERMHI